MLKVGRDPILHHIINNFKQYGYNDILMSINYKGGNNRKLFSRWCSLWGKK